ncbi:MAG: hypothetical protein V1495_09380 [Pseudomonadota bacterium]
MISESSKPPVRVIDSLWTFVLAVCVVGPLALPLFWRNPRFSRQTKVIVSIVVILFTVLLTIFAGALIGYLTGQLADFAG